MRFDSYHPMINLIYFVVAMTCTLCFEQPIFLFLSFCCAFAYSGKKLFLFHSSLLLPALGYAAWYAGYHHFGVTILMTNSIGNKITLEALFCGVVRGIKWITIVMWMSCVFELITADKVVYLFGRISPKLSLFLSVLLRTIPRIGWRTKRIESSREGIGRGVAQGNVFEKVRNAVALLSILVTWTLEDFVESSNSMKSRGSSLKGRTAFSIYRFDYRDRGLLLFFFGCMTVLGMAVLLDQTVMYFAPVLVIHPITGLSVVFYAVYALFLLLPLILQMVEEYRFL